MTCTIPLNAHFTQFDSKPIGPYESDSDDVDESLTVPRPPEQDVSTEARLSLVECSRYVPKDDPIIEYEDEFGRARTGRRSEIPRHLLPSENKEDPEDIDPYVICMPFSQ